MSSHILPEPAGGFQWAQAPWGPVLRCLALWPSAEHCFTGKHLSRRPGPLSHESWTAVGAYFGLPESAVARVAQVHGNEVVVVDSPEPGRDAPRADALITSRPDVVLSVRVADCVPLLLADTRLGCVAAVHAGWRGTAALIALRAVERMKESFGTMPEDLIAALGPAIAPCCYQVGAVTRNAFEAQGHHRDRLDAWFRTDSEGRLRLDVGRANQDQLIEAGVPAAQIYAAGVCTSTEAAVFHSYRRDGNEAGRMLAAIRMRGAPTA